MDFSLYLITDRKATPDGRTLSDMVTRALAGGVRAVQLREKDLSAAELFPLALELRSLTRQHGALLLINDRIDVALAVDADGVHLGHRSLSVATARDLLGRNRLIGVSTHDPREIIAAHQAGADFATFGPVFATPSKAPFGPPQGLDRLHEACMASDLPIFALGGITADNLAESLSRGACGVGLIRPVMAADDPEEAARQILDQLFRCKMKPPACAPPVLF